MLGRVFPLLRSSSWRRLPSISPLCPAALVPGTPCCSTAGSHQAALSGEPLRVFLVAGEPSGDELGGALMRSLLKLSPAPVVFSGIGGPRMESAGLQSLLPMSSLSVMGFAELLPHLWRLREAMSTAVAAATADPPPHAIVTIDYKGFNLRLLARVQQHAARTGRPCPALIHYVAPSVWAVRGGSPARMARLAPLLDALLCVLPFEPPLWAAAGLRGAHYVGHPVLEAWPKWELSRRSSSNRAATGQGCARPLMVLLPGSRRQEVARHLPLFEKAVSLLAVRHPGLTCVLPMVADQREAAAAQVSRWAVPASVVDAGQLGEACRRADAALACSGSVTAQLAAAGVPTVVAYRAHPLTELIARRIVKTPYVALPNIVVGREVMPEALLGSATPGRLAELLAELLEDPITRQRQAQGAEEFMQALRASAPEVAPSARAAQIVLDCISATRSLSPGGAAKAEEAQL
eukprot:jgi/Tetstr1/430264/TSEL_020092.t1